MAHPRTDLIATDADGNLVVRTIRIRVVDGPDRGREHELDRGTAILGKGTAADLQLDDPKTSRTHLELAVLDTGVRVRDLGSTNGTFFRGARLEGALVLRPPFELSVGHNRVQVAAADMPSADAPAPNHRVSAPVGPSAAAHAIREALGRVADRRTPVCLAGDSGVGKSAAARALAHAAQAPARVLHLGASLAIDEVGAAFAAAANGALILEHLDGATAAQLEALRGVLDDREAGRLSLWPISTSRVDPRRLVEEGRLPRSLFFQLAAVRLTIPPLADRPEDAGALAKLLAAEVGAPSDVAPRAVAELGASGFEGNGWGLRRRIVELVTLGQQATRPELEAPLPFEQAKARMVERFTERYVRELLERHDGDVTRAAAEAGVPPQDLARLAERHGLG